MHIFFSYIGGGGISPLALIAKQAGYDVSGTDKKDSSPYLNLLRKAGIENIGIGTTDEFIKNYHQQKSIDWYVYSSAVEKENPNHPELVFCRQNNIKMSKRDELLNQILEEKNLKMLAIAGTHGKTTTTAMAIWAFKKLNLSISYSVGAKLGFGDMGHFDPKSQYFVYECDEFDRNFLAFTPYVSMITGVSWDHHEIFPTKDNYNQAFLQFLDQSHFKVVWQEDKQYLNFDPDDKSIVLDPSDPRINLINLKGRFNRRDAFLVATSMSNILDIPIDKLVNVLSNFPGLSRRFEKITQNLYSDYAHTPEKIQGVMSVAKESLLPNQKLVIVYEPLTNRRMHYMKHLHKDVFEGANKIYWVPSHLAREDPNQKILSPSELIDELNPKLKLIAEPASLDDQLQNNIAKHLANNDLVVCLSGGGGDSLDEWVRSKFSHKQ